MRAENQIKINHGSNPAYIVVYLAAIHPIDVQLIIHGPGLILITILPPSRTFRGDGQAFHIRGN